MASFFLAPDPVQSTFFIPGGAVPGNGAQLFIYVAGSVATKTTVYKDNAGNTQWTNPIVLDSGGNLPNGGVVWIPSGVSIKAVWAPANDTDPPTSPYRTIDNIAGINDTTGSQTEWITGPTPTFVSGTQFTLVGDQTPNFTIGRRTKFTVTAGTVYGRITNSVFGVLTTVTLQMDGSTALDAGISAVSYGLLASKILSIPKRVAKTSSTDTYSATVGITAYVAGDEYEIQVSSTNTSATPNLNLDGLGALSIKLQSGSNPLIGQITGHHLFRYDAATSTQVCLTAGYATSTRSFKGATTAVFTPTPGMKFSEVWVVGGGAAGGGAASTGAAQWSAGGGGGSGGAAYGVLTAGQIGVSVNVTSGPGGSATSGTAGTNGSTSAFGAFVVASGGLGGATMVAAAAGGAAGGVGGGGTTGDLLIVGADGGGAIGTNAGGNGVYLTGNGGSSIFGGGARGIGASGQNGGVAASSTAFGAGGSGGGNPAAQPAVPGGSGAPGLIIIKEYF